MQDCPFVPEELLKALEERFPDTLPDNPKPPHEMGVLIGQQKVIRFLRHQHNIQHEQLLKGGSA